MSGPTDLIAIDGSGPADHAFNWYLENMHKEGRNVILAHCIEHNIDIGLPGAAADVDAICKKMKDKKDSVDVMTDGYMTKLREKKIPAKLLCEQGVRPGDFIIKVAKENGVNSVVMGTRGLGAIRRTLLGSVSEYVIHHADCTVTVVRPPQEAA